MNRVERGLREAGYASVGSSYAEAARRAGFKVIRLQRGPVHYLATGPDRASFWVVRWAAQLFYECDFRFPVSDDDGADVGRMAERLAKLDEQEAKALLMEQVLERQSDPMEKHRRFLDVDSHVEWEDWEPPPKETPSIDWMGDGDDVWSANDGT